ncbi:hypothetical protein PVAP13_6KG363312 [Panicum virgatum]|uniref:Uncharacterized protein n=1 Tax=Panicum virgatum TaxID=38727 RepID=A0A8T0RIU8_PANVG|nr:hypothetical protein PVAP13_6KG363312 [Panicum virgatum]
MDGSYREQSLSCSSDCKRSPSPFLATANPLHLAGAVCLLPSRPSALIVGAPFVASPLSGGRLLPALACVGRPRRCRRLPEDWFLPFDRRRRRRRARCFPLLRTSQHAEFGYNL